MTDTQKNTLNLTADDGHEIAVSVYRPQQPASGIIQILHGLGEHADRYARFAAAANDRGLIVVIHNHRGHGADAKTYGFFADQNGWEKLTADALLVQEHICNENPGLPLSLLGHSMGSYIAQYFAMHHNARLSALLLSGSTWPSRTQVTVARLLALIVGLKHGAKGYSPLLDKLFFGDFNKKFAPARTELDWLSRDESEVDLYIDDPLCGGPYTTGLWRDLLRGLSFIGSDNSVTRVPGTLPILITGGEMDPVGGDRGMGNLAMHYAQTGHSRLKVRIYPGGRHEMLNETNRDDVTNDWLDWIAENAR
ncbi:MAG: alpha/beta fold hydrolase [Woeseiaceae bacterium]|nr:alpha/beta fold hydrolase [Woeseiaceae bacterium]